MNVLNFCVSISLPWLQEMTNRHLTKILSVSLQWSFKEHWTGSQEPGFLFKLCHRSVALWPLALVWPLFSSSVNMEFWLDLHFTNVHQTPWQKMLIGISEKKRSMVKYLGKYCLLHLLGYSQCTFLYQRLQEVCRGVKYSFSLYKSDFSKLFGYGIPLFFLFFFGPSLGIS